MTVNSISPLLCALDSERRLTIYHDTVRDVAAEAEVSPSLVVEALRGVPVQRKAKELTRLREHLGAHTEELEGAGRGPRLQAVLGNLDKALESPRPPRGKLHALNKKVFTPLARGTANCMCLLVNGVPAFDDYDWPAADAPAGPTSHWAVRVLDPALPSVPKHAPLPSPRVISAASWTRFACADFGAVQLPDPRCVDERVDDLLDAYAKAICAGLPGSPIEATAFGSAFVRPVRVHAADGTSLPLHSGDDTTPQPEVVLYRNASGGWGATAESCTNDADALYRAILEAAGPALVPLPDSVAGLRQRIAERVGGRTRKVLPMDVANARVAAFSAHYRMTVHVQGTHWTPRPELPASEAAALVVWCVGPDAWVAVHRRDRAAIATKEQMQACVVYTPPPGPHSLHAALLFLLDYACAKGDAQAGQHRLTNENFDKVKDLVDHGVERRERTGLRLVNFAEVVHSRLQSALDGLAPEARSVVDAQYAAFNRRHPYSPFRNQDEYDSVSYYIDHLQRPGVWGHHVAVDALVGPANLRARLWTVAGKDLVLCAVHQPTPSPRGTVDLVNRGNSHYTCIQRWDDDADLPTTKPAGTFAVPRTRAEELDCGGGGDCFFRVMAHLLNTEGVRDTPGAQGYEKAVRTLRQATSKHFHTVLRDAQRGDGARRLVKELLSQIEEDSTMPRHLRRAGLTRNL